MTESKKAYLLEPTADLVYVEGDMRAFSFCARQTFYITETGDGFFFDFTTPEQSIVCRNRNFFLGHFIKIIRVTRIIDGFRIL